MEKKSGSDAMKRVIEQTKKAFANMQQHHVPWGLDVVIFPELMILEQDIDTWPCCDVLIAFYSKGFPLEKAIAYYEKTRPVSLCDLYLQRILKDREKMYEMLDELHVPTLPRMVVKRDRENNVTQGDEIIEDTDWIEYQGNRMEKPFVEKPLDAENHDVVVYYKGGGGRRLFRKVKDKCSEYDVTLTRVRRNGSFIYETYSPGDPPMDIKVYGVYGIEPFFHAEMRRAPTMHSTVLRKSDGVEQRMVIELSQDELEMCEKILRKSDQFVCGFDILRSEPGRSVVIDVNGWSFVKKNAQYYERCGLKLAERIWKACGTSP